jgi:hypothetical protein
MAAETAATRMMGELGRLAETETRFYGRLAAELTGLPKAYGSAFDPLTGRFVLVLEDLAVDSCEFPDTLHPLEGQDRLDRRASRPASRNVLGPRARLAVHGVGRQRLIADRASAENVRGPAR